MKKKIAVFIGEIRSEFQNSVLSSIYDRAEQLGYLVFVFAVYGAYGNSVLYSEGERAIVYLPDLKEFDGIIVAAGTFNITGMDAELEKRILETAACPVVYLRGTGEDFYNIQIDDEPAMEEMTEHFINVHGFRDICFMQGIMSMEDGKKRYQGFLNAMQKAEIPVTEHMVFEGNFWKDKGEEAVSWFMEGRETYPQAIICANDFMAISVCEELEKRGIHVPEDVCVSGYDNLTTAQHFRPSITSLDVRFQKMGITAVDIIDRKRNNQEQKRVVKVRPKLILHRSCGCGKQEIEDDGYQLQNILNMQNARIFRAMMMLSESQDADTDAECERIIEGYFRETNAKKDICVYAWTKRTREIKRSPIPNRCCSIESVMQTERLPIAGKYLIEEKFFLLTVLKKTKR